MNHFEAEMLKNTIGIREILARIADMLTVAMDDNSKSRGTVDSEVLEAKPTMEGGRFYDAESARDFARLEGYYVGDGSQIAERGREVWVLTFDTAWLCWRNANQKKGSS